MKQLLVAILVLFPSIVFGAGFAKQSLFLSQATVTEGDTVFIYAIIENDSPNNFNGTLKYTDDSGAIGNTAVSMKPGEAATLSITWRPSAGQHNVSANLVSGNGEVVESENATFYVNTKPSPAAPNNVAQSSSFSSSDASTTNTIIQTSAPIESWLASSTPAAVGYAAPVLQTIDSARVVAAQNLDRGTAWSKSKLHTLSSERGGWMHTVWTILATLVLYICAALTYIITNVGVFYPIFAVVFFFILWRLYRLARR